MDNATKKLIELITVIGCLFDALVIELGVFGTISKEVHKDGSALISIRLETSLWAEGDKAWRIEALKGLLADYCDGREEHQSFTKVGTEYRTVFGSFLCTDLEQQRSLLDALAVLLERTSPRV